MFNRSSGILMHITSLPSPYGIGTLGKDAYRFADFLKKAGQTYWQMLPLGHTGYANSPYQAFSAFAGNPYLIDLDLLKEDGLLKQEEIDACDFGNDDRVVDFGKIYENRYQLLLLAMKRDTNRQAFETFCTENVVWLDDYALFMALKVHFQMKGLTEWEDESIRLRVPEAMAHYREKLNHDVEFYSYLQYLFFKQWKELKTYVNSLGIQIIGDLPIYVSLDSADTWSNPKVFQLDETGKPRMVAGVPPDYFTADGQLWGNPLYDWDYLRDSNYDWWIKRIGATTQLFDVLRIDHFRGFESYYAIPAGAKNAKVGQWMKGPGIGFLNIINQWFTDLKIIAEDLGFITPEVKELLRASGYPGMKVIQFAFDSREPSDYLPHNYDRNCVAYLGTHDNTTIAGWFYEADSDDIEYAKKYLGLNKQEGYNMGFIRGVMSSVANLAVVAMQDYLNLDAKNRMNKPSTVTGNWQWRILHHELTDKLASRIFEITQMYGRIIEQE